MPPGSRRWLLPLMLWSACAFGMEPKENRGCCSIETEGRLEYDYNRYHDDVAELAEGHDSLQDARRIEIALVGEIGEHLKWTASYDFQEQAWLDGYLKYRRGDHRKWYLQAGQFKQPVGLEELSSGRTGDFISKASAINTFALSRRLGAAYGTSTDKAGLVASVFGRTITWDDDPSEPSRGYAIRGYWLPLYQSGRALHLGLSYAGLETAGDQARFRTRPNADLTEVRLVDSGHINGIGHESIVGAEVMWLMGAMKVQGEYLRAQVRRDGDLKDFAGDGWYLSGVWNLTGEAWDYRDGVPVTPKQAQLRHGLWQAGVRFDRIDLDDGSLRPSAIPGPPSAVDGVLGGRMEVWTVGINWYWRSHFKLMLNYVMAHGIRYSPASQSFADDEPHIFETRAQIYW